LGYGYKYTISLASIIFNFDKNKFLYPYPSAPLLVRDKNSKGLFTYMVVAKYDGYKDENYISEQFSNYLSTNERIKKNLRLFYASVGDDKYVFYSDNYSNYSYVTAYFNDKKAMDLFSKKLSGQVLSKEELDYLDSQVLVQGRIYNNKKMPQRFFIGPTYKDFSRSTPDDIYYKQQPLLFEFLSNKDIKSVRESGSRYYKLLSVKSYLTALSY
jgi:hypothetical protein